MCWWWHVGQISYDKHNLSVTHVITCSHIVKMARVNVKKSILLYQAAQPSNEILEILANADAQPSA